MDLRYYYIYDIIEDSVKEVLYGPEVLLHLLYLEYSLKRFCMNLRYYIYYITEDSVKEVLYGPEVLLHLLYHRRVC